MDNLAGVSVVLVCVSLLMFVVSLVIDRRVADGRMALKASKSMLMMRPKSVAVLLLTYAAIAFSQDIALEWLASIAILVCCSASLLRRGVAILMARKGKEDPTGEDGQPDAPTGDGAEERPLVVAGRMTEMFSDILIYVSAIDLVLLFVMALVEKVIPYYVGLAIG